MPASLTVIRFWSDNRVLLLTETCVVALVEDSATVKTFYKEDGYYRLQPENDSMEPILVHDNLKILGKVFGVFRLYE